MEPVYSRSDYPTKKTCFKNGYSDVFCDMSVRNTPYFGWTPAFVVWPLTEDHVQTAVQFALTHNLCIMVAGTGHDFMNRHSCEDGIFIRMTLMKDINFDLDDSSGFGWADGNV
jgi:FAD/FMN-containing dehydrogenase